MGQARGGITNKQAKLLGLLCRELGLPYNGSGLRAFEASCEISRLQALKAKRRAEILANGLAPQTSRQPRRSPEPIAQTKAADDGGRQGRAAADPEGVDGRLAAATLTRSGAGAPP
jgi:hypothetical protein